MILNESQKRKLLTEPQSWNADTKNEKLTSVNKSQTKQDGEKTGFITIPLLSTCFSRSCSLMNCE